MKNIIPFPHPSAIEEAAALWLVKIDQGKLAPEQAERLQRWLDADTRHRDALIQMANLWGEMDSLHMLAQMFPLQAEADASAVKIRPDSRNWLQRHPLAAFFGSAVCASLALTVAILAKDPAFSPSAPDVIEPSELVYQTDLGKQSQARLTDGSVVTLNTQSKVRVHFSPQERSIYLLSGEAHFEVAKNPQRPFVVYAGSGEVRAVGTAFSVRVDSQQDVKVAVSEGTVQVVANVAATNAKPGKAAKTRAAARTLKPTMLTLNKGGTASYHEVIETYSYVNKEKLEQQLAWKSGKWIFDGETLAEVIAEANRYSGKPIQIIDPAIAQLLVGGYFNAGDIDALLATLAAGFNIKVQRNADQIQLSSLSTPPTAVP